MQQIRKRLEQCIHLMEGDFVVKESHYEKELCDIVQWECFDSRYYDAYDGKTYIEIKKGQSMMWFNMIRYAEIFVKIGTQNTITLFVKYNKKKKRVDEIFIMDTKRILNHLNMTPTKAACCIILNKDSKRSLHMQAGATANDMREMSSMIVVNPHYLAEECFKMLKQYTKQQKRIRKKHKKERKKHIILVKEYFSMLKQYTKQQKRIRKKRKRVETSDRVSGVTWNKVSQAWQVRVRVDGKEKTLGRFKEKEDAISLRNHAFQLISFEWLNRIYRGKVMGKGKIGWKIKWTDGSGISDVPKSWVIKNN